MKTNLIGNSFTIDSSENRFSEFSYFMKGFKKHYAHFLVVYAKTIMIYVFHERL